MNFLIKADKALRKKMNQRGKQIEHKSDIMTENIYKSSCYTKDFNEEKLKEHSNNLKKRLIQAALKRSQLKIEMPSWQEQLAKENITKALVSQRLKNIVFQKKIRPTLKEVLKVLVTFHFMRSLSIFFDILSLQEHDINVLRQPSTAAHLTRIENLSNARHQRDSKFNFVMLSTFKQKSSIRLIVNQFSLSCLETQLIARAELISKKAFILTKFGRNIARRRLIDLCILAANFNIFINDRYPRKFVQSSTMQRLPTTLAFLQKCPKILIESKHLGFTMMQKIRSACIEFNSEKKETTEFLINLLRNLLKEMLPFSVHWMDLQFDRSYFLIKKIKMTDEVTSLDVSCKLEALNNLLNYRNRVLKQNIRDYKGLIEEFISQNPKLISEQRTAYLYDQDIKHLEKMVKHNDFSLAGQKQDKLPYQSKKRLFMFSELVNSSLPRPGLRFSFTEEEAVLLLEDYNKILKAQFFKNQEEQSRISKMRNRTREKKEKEGTLESLPDD